MAWEDVWPAHLSSFERNCPFENGPVCPFHASSRQWHASLHSQKAFGKRRRMTFSHPHRWVCSIRWRFHNMSYSLPSPWSMCTSASSARRVPFPYLLDLQLIPCLDIFDVWWMLPTPYSTNGTDNMVCPFFHSPRAWHSNSLLRWYNLPSRSRETNHYAQQREGCQRPPWQERSHL